ncbi:hypothetical protein AB0C90_18865 [Streptomyces sp. NPDC048550]|uniref:hypothetical protein n=1 Tax=unclassified Streptomyces TaxID=2593676 RepID=UPI00342CFCDA
MSSVPVPTIAHHWLLPKQPSQMHLLDAVGQLGVLLPASLLPDDTDPTVFALFLGVAARR